MSGFEFVLMPIAIILGLGVSSILSGWGDQVRARHRAEVYPLQLAWSGVLLIFLMGYLWALWTFRGLAWTFPLYILMAAPALILSLAAYIIRVDVSVDAPTPRTQYLQNSGPIFVLLALMPLTLIAFSFVPAIRESVSNPFNLVAITIFRVMLSAGIASLAWFKSERAHWTGIVVISLVVLGIAYRLAAGSIEGAA